MRTYPYRFYVALDGNGINGFEGMAGVCLFLFDPSDNAYAYKVQYFDGAAAGHATTVNPGRSVGFLGNAGQHLLFYDAATLDEVDRSRRCSSRSTTPPCAGARTWCGSTTPSSSPRSATTCTAST